MINKTFEIMAKMKKNRIKIEDISNHKDKKIIDEENNDKNEKDKGKKVVYEKNKDFVSIIRNVWKFLWYDDSVLSWLANIVLAYLFIVFIFYPGMGFLLNTSYPLVAVVSGSMEHMIISHDDKINPNLCGTNYDKTDLFVNFNSYWEKCGSWYSEHNISKEEFSKFTFKNGFNKGDIVFIYGTNPKNLKIGDVIVFKSNVRTEPIIHRIVDINTVNEKLVFTTKGDHNGSFGSVDMNITSDKILGRGIFRVPFLGWFKIWVTMLVSPEQL